MFDDYGDDDDDDDDEAFHLATSTASVLQLGDLSDMTFINSHFIRVSFHFYAKS